MRIAMLIALPVLVAASGTGMALAGDPPRGGAFGCGDGESGLLTGQLLPGRSADPGPVRNLTLGPIALRIATKQVFGGNRGNRASTVFPSFSKSAITPQLQAGWSI